MNVFDRVDVVLVRPEGPLNVGSVARLCGNFGCSLRLVQPLTSVTHHDAMKMAHPSQALLEQAPIFATLGQALTDVSLALATSAKLAEATAAPWLSVARASLLVPPEGERLALVFGNERTGLSIDEAAQCHRVVRLPTPGLTESLNLSHAVAVALTLFSEATQQPFDTRGSQPSRQALARLLTEQLDAHGFFKGGARAREGFQPRLQELLSKMDLTERDCVLLKDIVSVISGTRAPAT
jgi:tRNA/rRNA methyltransferase